MSEELQSMVQIIELYGRGLGALGRAIRFSAKGAAKGVDVAKVKTMQCKMKLHYASTGNRKTMKLSDLEKLTGGQYNILNIPLENERGLLGFYDRLKKMRVSFAELPDLQLGDGYTQIAYNPMDAENVKMVVQYYRKHLSEMPKDISVDQYMDMAGKDGRELLDELAEKGYTEGMHIEQLLEIQERVRDDKYIPVSLNMESLLLQENKDSYVFKIPKSRLNAALEHAFVVPKKDCLLLDRGQTLVTCLDRQGKTNLYHMDAHGHVVEENPLNMKNEDFISNYKIVISDNLLSFNDSEHLVDGEKQYQFSTFLKHLSSEALVLTYAGIHGVTRDVEKKFNQILSIRKRIAANKRIDIYEVTPEMVHEVKPDYSARDIKAVFDYLDGRISVEKMLEEDGMEGEAFEDPNGEGPDLKNDVMDINVQKLFDLFLDRMSDLEKFFALIEIGCSDKYATMTVSQFSVDQTFLNIVAADKKYAKNIQTGDVVIKRPNRQAYTDRDVELKDVKFVGGNVVRYQREQTKLRWKKLEEVLTEDDIMGNKSVEYFQQKWEELIKKYENLC